MLKTSIRFIVLALIFICFYSCRQSINNEQDTGNGLVDPPPFGPGLNLISPAAGDIWLPGTSSKIRWEVDPNEFKVNILLYRKTEFKFVIAENLDNAGEYLWNIPFGIQQSHHYRIHIVYSENSFQNHFISEEFYIIE